MDIKDSMGCLKTFQQSAVTRIRLEVFHCLHLGLNDKFKKGKRPSAVRKRGLHFLPALKRIQVLFFPNDKRLKPNRAKRNIRTQLDTFLAGREIRITFQMKFIPHYHYVNG
jgi:hypothetical protein